MLTNINLVKFLDAIVYRVKINKNLCDVKLIISCIEQGFSSLNCSQERCGAKAVMWVKLDTDIQAELFCEEHAKSINHFTASQHYFDSELKVNRSILFSLERLLIVIQEQMEYLRSVNSNKNMTVYSSIKPRLDEEYENLK